MINLKQLSLRRGSKLLLDKTSIIIHPGQRVGITGANGTGKSSLFALILGKIDVDSGELEVPRQLAIAHVAQETPATEIPAIEYALQGDQELMLLQQQLEQAQQLDQGEKIAQLYQQLETIDAYTANSRASSLLHGLGFTTDQLSQATSHFSGGWRMRLNLAQALMCRSDILLLDEPTNHLDLDAVMWLENWLTQYQGTLLLISHDRDFLDSITTHITHIEQQSLKLYTGNYSDFEKLRAIQLSQQASAYEKQQKEIAHMQDFVRRFGAKASKAKQAQSRVKSLQRMELIAAAHVDSPFHFSFKQHDKFPRPLLRLDEVQVAYADKLILNKIDLTLQPGDRLGLLGANGAGKSTLIKLLAGEIKAQSGDYIPAQDLKIGYFAQHQLEQLRSDQSPLWHLQQLDKKAKEQDLRNFLGGFDFIGDKVNETVAPFSGGEKARLVLSLLIYQQPNLLLLDEPTNHLDLEMRHALSVALQEFEGAIIIVSHDRHLLRSVCDQFLLVADGQADYFDGDLNDYHTLLSQLNKEEITTKDGNTIDNTSQTSSNRKEQKRIQAEQRQRSKPLRNELTKLEKKLAQLNQQKLTIETALSEQDIYNDENKSKLKECLQQQTENAQNLNNTENLWMEISEQLEQFNQE